MDGAPVAWRDYIRGQTRRRQLWKANVRSTNLQLPKVCSADDKVLQQLVNLPPKHFEAVIVALFREMKTVEHAITQTRYINDMGFDFFGTFTMPLPVPMSRPVAGGRSLGYPLIFCYHSVRAILRNSSGGTLLRNTETENQKSS